VSITVFDEAPTKVTLSTLLKSSVPWGVAMGIVSTIWGGFFKRKSPEDGTSASHLELFFLQSGTRFTLEEIVYWGATGQTGFAGSSVVEGRSRRAWR